MGTHYNVGMIIPRRRSFPIAFGLILCTGLPAQNPTTGGEFTVEPPTLEMLEEV
jgi:hypothetical protein